MRISDWSSDVCSSDLLVLLDPVADLHVPADDLRFRDAFADVRQPERKKRHDSPSILQNLVDRLADANRAGEIGPSQAVRLVRVEAGHALDGRFDMVEVPRLHPGGKFRPEIARQRPIMYEQTPKPDRR